MVQSCCAVVNSPRRKLWLSDKSDDFLSLLCSDWHSCLFSVNYLNVTPNILTRIDGIRDEITVSRSSGFTSTSVTANTRSGNYS